MKTNVIYNKSCLPRMDEIDDNSITLAITSLPYNVDLDYGKETDDNLPFDEYKEFTQEWLKECIRIHIYTCREGVFSRCLRPL